MDFSPAWSQDGRGTQSPKELTKQRKIRQRLASVVYSILLKLPLKHSSPSIRIVNCDIIMSNLWFQSKEIKENVARYIKEIADVLAFVNRQMILIFKTNDLLRTIEYNLGTQNNMGFFVHMSRACFR